MPLINTLGSSSIRNYGFYNPGAINVAITASTTNVNLFALAGSPTKKGVYNFTINSGVTVGASSTATAAIVTGTFPTGSIVNLIVNGNVYGMGGAGGAAASADYGNGLAAGPALSCSYPINITGTGKIYGGGGGGTSTEFSGGGGGQGAGTSAGGAGNYGPSGYSGSPSGPGAGGDASAKPGATWGLAGANNTYCYSCIQYNPIGGAGGNAITKNGYAVTVSGPSVLGAVV